MANFLRHEPCPKCRAIGKDRKGNNLGIWDDGSSYCFACGFGVPGDEFYLLRKSNETPGLSTESSKSNLPVLPSDSTEDLPEVCWQYVRKYGLSERDVREHTLMWTGRWQRLVFPYFGPEGLLGWQGRYLGDEERPKWFSQGDLKSILHIVGNQKSRTCVLVEDVVSAIKVGHLGTVAASPLFGSHLSTQRILQLKLLFDKLIIWLDPDMRLKVMKFANSARQFDVDTSIIFSDKDPKDHTVEQIKEFINA